MDFIEAKHAAAREIALAVGVPPMLLGIPGDNTYSNYQEAQRAFWRQTVLPLVKRTGAALSQWLAPAFASSGSALRSRPPDAISLRPDLDQVDALSSEREALWARLERASFLTANEKRTALGYGPLEMGGDALPGAVAPRSLSSLGPENADLPFSFLKYSPDQPRVPRGDPDGGQWRDVGGGHGGAGTEDRVIPDANPDDVTTPGARLAQADEPVRSPINVEREDTALGGHTVRSHVARPDEELLSIVRRDRYQGLFVTVARRAQGSFRSLEDANDLVNRTLEANPDRIRAVVEGAVDDDEIDMRFGYVTGKEAFRPDPDSEPYIRPTYSVRVRIQKDSRSTKGYRVFTAYPFNPAADDGKGSR
jgi:hypothetical protein